MVVKAAVARRKKASESENGTNASAAFHSPHLLGAGSSRLRPVQVVAGPGNGSVSGGRIAGERESSP